MNKFKITGLSVNSGECKSIIIQEQDFYSVCLNMNNNQFFINSCLCVVVKIEVVIDATEENTFDETEQ